ncbi:MAG: radical SAM protein [Cyanobacteria bacterium P01_E01_bin.6]
MGSIAALPDRLPQSSNGGAVLTFIVPAPDGCNLACPYCFIDQRLEPASTNTISPSDYRKFVEDIIKKEKVSALCIQGYEPLLDTSMEFTLSILQTGKDLIIPTSIVTNGTNLTKQAAVLTDYKPWKLCVSLDASLAEQHDKQRGRNGAFDLAVAGLRKSLEVFGPETEIAVASVLIPKRRHVLDGMPRLLANIGVKKWIVTNLQTIKKGSTMSVLGNPIQILNDLRNLKQNADSWNIEFVVDDEFGSLKSDQPMLDKEQFEAIRIRKLTNKSGVYRLLPNGQCSMGLDILKRSQPGLLEWNPRNMDAATFLQSVKSHYAQQIEAVP